MAAIIAKFDTLKLLITLHFHLVNDCTVRNPQCECDDQLRCQDFLTMPLGVRFDIFHSVPAIFSCRINGPLQPPCPRLFNKLKFYFRNVAFIFFPFLFANLLSNNWTPLNSTGGAQHQWCQHHNYPILTV